MRPTKALRWSSAPSDISLFTCGNALLARQPTRRFRRSVAQVARPHPKCPFQVRIHSVRTLRVTPFWVPAVMLAEPTRPTQYADLRMEAGSAARALPRQDRLDRR